MTARPTCDSCRWWDGERSTDPESGGLPDESGACRYNPPVILAATDSVYGEWPVVGCEDWCRMHEPILTPEEMRRAKAGIA